MALGPPYFPAGRREKRNDVLVCSSIIESGLDIRSANTPGRYSSPGGPDSLAATAGSQMKGCGTGTGQTGEGGSQSVASNGPE